MCELLDKFREFMKLRCKEQAKHNQGETMSNKNRVLTRRGARELTAQEIALISASADRLTGVCTDACTISSSFMAGQSTYCDSECPQP